MKESEKFTIRVNFKPQQNSLTEDEKKYQYRWGRIIGCSLLVFIAICSTIYYGSSYLSQDNTDDNHTAMAQTSNADSTSNTSQPPAIENAIPAATPHIANETEVPPAQARLEDATIENINVDTIPVNTKESELSKITSAITDNTSAALNTVAANVPETEPHNSMMPFTQVKTEILSEAVTRFIIAQNVIANEPVGTINDIFFDNNIATIYAFSQVDDSKNTTLYYQWSLNNENIAKVRIGVIGNRWRSHSSKFIQSNMHGQWKVELQNQNGDVLATSQFKY